MEEEFTYDDFIQYKNVPRGTFHRLQNYVELLKKWQKTINLISQSTLSEIWIRHIIDSIQIIDLISEDNIVMDIGSGAGFPGLILAILGIQKMTLVESDARKVAFLREAARITETNVTIVNQRVEEISLRDFTTVTGRGFASLASIFNALSKTLSNRHNMLLLKGKTYLDEVNEAQKNWSFDYKASSSITHNEGVVLSICNISPKGVAA